MAAQEQLTVCGFVANPSAPTPTPSGADNSVTYSYKLVGVDSQGNLTAASTAGTTTHGPTTLSSINHIVVTWTDPANAVFVKVYRTVGGTTQGLIGTVAAGVQTLNDTGLAGDGSTASAVNGTGVGPASNADILFHREKYVQFGGTFSATVKVQGTIDGTTWADAASATASSAAVVSVAETWVQIRIVMTAYSSGTATAWWAGHREG